MLLLQQNSSIDSVFIATNDDAFAFALLSYVIDSGLPSGLGPQYVGDPLECALLEGLASHSRSSEEPYGWTIDATSMSATWAPPVRPEAEAEAGAETESTGDSTQFSMHVLLTHPFDAVMQRMTVFAAISRDTCSYSTAERNSSSPLERVPISGTVGGYTPHVEYLIASKGSPESIFECLSVSQREDHVFRDTYFRTFRGLAGQGKRVISFASKSITGLSVDDSRDNRRADAESDLLFQGFVSFHCPLRYL